jgi:hypothetical protein
MSYKPKTLFSLIEEINKSIFLPHIQRPFVWEEDQVLRLFDSLMRGYPIQTLLFWRTKSEIKAREFMTDVVWDPDLSDYYNNGVSREGVDKIFVLDGQQRIQSLYSIFKGTLASDTGVAREAYFEITSGAQPADGDIAYNLKFSSESLGLPWFPIADLLGKHQQRNAGELADELNDALDIMNDAGAIEARESVEERRERQRRVRSGISQLLSLLREEKHFWIQTLDGVANDYPYKRVLEIFVRVNSGGTKLDASDLMFAAMKEGWDDIEQAIEDTTELLNGSNLKFDKTFPLKCLLVSHGKGAEASPEKFVGSAGDQLLSDMEAGWSKGEVAFRKLRDFMTQELRLYADKLIRSYNSFIPIFDFLSHNVDPTPESRALMRAYHYKAQLFGWYSQSTDTTINTLHGIVGKPILSGFPLAEIKNHFRGRGLATELQKHHLDETRLRFILLNLIYVETMGSSPFDVKYKGNDPHVDHIYPQHGLRSKLGLGSAEINRLGNYRFVGAKDNIRKRAELPASYFGGLKVAGIKLKPHLLLDDVSDDPSKLLFDVKTYKDFRDRRLEQIWSITNAIVNPELVKS